MKPICLAILFLTGTTQAGTITTNDGMQNFTIISTTAQLKGVEGKLVATAKVRYVNQESKEESIRYWAVTDCKEGYGKFSVQTASGEWTNASSWVMDGALAKDVIAWTVCGAAVDNAQKSLKKPML